MEFQKILRIIRIPNYHITFTNNANLKIAYFFAYSLNISYSYYLKTKSKFFTQFSYISYNPYMYPKYYSNEIGFENCRKCPFFKYIILYRIYEKDVEILDIRHSKSNY